MDRKCPKCRQPVGASVPRCSACGNRLFFQSAEPLPKENEPPVQRDRPNPAPQYELTAMQKRILTAAHEGGPISVYRAPGSQQGEVKSGSQRFFGNAAVAAVATMIPPGLLEAVGDDCFELTPTGLRLAESLS